MPIAIPLVNGQTVHAATPTSQAADYAAYPQPVSTYRGVQTPLLGEHNSPAHVGVLVAVALAAIILLHGAGFRFVVDAGIARGR